MSQLPSPQHVPADPSPAEPFAPSPNESAILWLVMGIACLFVGYLVVDAIIQRMRQRRLERERRKRARQAASEMAEAQNTVRPLNEPEATERPPPR